MQTPTRGQHVELCGDPTGTLLSQCLPQKAPGDQLSAHIGSGPMHFLSSQAWTRSVITAHGQGEEGWLEVSRVLLTWTRLNFSIFIKVVDLMMKKCTLFHLSLLRNCFLFGKVWFKWIPTQHTFRLSHLHPPKHVPLACQLRLRCSEMTWYGR